MYSALWHTVYIEIGTDLVAASDLDDCCNVGNGDWPCGGA